MRTIKMSSFFIICILMMASLTTKAQKSTLVKETFKVWGNCEMCKSKIEKSLKSVDGVKSGKWNVETKKMIVKFESDKTSLDKIKKAIAHVGYDTEEHKASDETYNNLHGCCQYDRK